MRRIRWKTKYLTGEGYADERNKRLVGILHELYNEMRAKEHCQDMEEFYGALTEVTEKRLSSRDLSLSGAAADRAVGTLLRSSLPLEALGTPACRDCNVCDLTEKRVLDWLTQNRELRRSDEAEAA